jgi:hypothetical protein
MRSVTEFRAKRFARLRKRCGSNSSEKSHFRLGTLAGNNFLSGLLAAPPQVLFGDVPLDRWSNWRLTTSTGSVTTGADGPDGGHQTYCYSGATSDPAIPRCTASPPELPILALAETTDQPPRESPLGYSQAKKWSNCVRR